MLIALLGCTGGPLGSGDVATYDLTLDVLSPSNQAPFADLDSLVLRLEHAVGEAEDYELASTTGSPQVEGLSDLEDTRLALLGYLGGELVSYGKSEPLTAHDETDVTARVLVTEVGPAAWLTLMERPSALGAVAADGLGSFWVFGGERNSFWGNNSDGKPTDTVLRLDVAPPDDLAFHDHSVMPEFQGEHGDLTTERIGHTATLLTGSAADAGLILVAGGHHHDLDFRDTSKTAWLFDPVSGEWTGTENNLRSARTMHSAVEFANGDVLLIGGYGADANESSLPRMQDVEIYRRGERKFEKADAFDDAYGAYGAAASLGSAGILYCGGFDIVASLWSSVDRCLIYDESGSATSVEPLPVALSHLAMVPLGEGRAMAIGGMTAQDLDFNDPGEGYGGTWIYDADADSWTSAGNLEIARGSLVAAARPDGSVLAIGGNEAGALYDGTAGASGPLVACAELWNGTSWALQDNCKSGDGSGALPTAAWMPSIAVDPDYGVVVVGGLDASNKPTESVSFWPSAPAL